MQSRKIKFYKTFLGISRWSRQVGQGGPRLHRAARRRQRRTWRWRRRPSSRARRVSQPLNSGWGQYGHGRSPDSARPSGRNISCQTELEAAATVHSYCCICHRPSGYSSSVKKSRVDSAREHDPHRHMHLERLKKCQQQHIGGLGKALSLQRATSKETK